MTIQGSTIQGGKPRLNPKMSSVSQINRCLSGTCKRDERQSQETDFISRKRKYSRLVKKKQVYQPYIMLFQHFILTFG